MERDFGRFADEAERLAARWQASAPVWDSHHRMARCRDVLHQQRFAAIVGGLRLILLRPRFARPVMHREPEVP